MVRLLPGRGTGSDQSWNNQDNWQGGIVPNADNFAYIYYTGTSKVSNSTQSYNTDNQYTCGNLAGIGYSGATMAKFPIVDADVTVRGIYLLVCFLPVAWQVRARSRSGYTET